MYFTVFLALVIFQNRKYLRLVIFYHTQLHILNEWSGISNTFSSYYKIGLSWKVKNDKKNSNIFQKSSRHGRVLKVRPHVRHVHQTLRQRQLRRVQEDWVYRQLSQSGFHDKVWWWFFRHFCVMNKFKFCISKPTRSRIRTSIIKQL